MEEALDPSTALGQKMSLLVPYLDNTYDVNHFNIAAEALS